MTLSSLQPGTRVVVALSGGVDSSVCASLLKEHGCDVIGITIKTWSNDECRDEKSKGCCSIRDIDDARSVARKIGIPYYVLDLSADFKERVIDYFVEDYLAGRTPNPCIECNNHIKFGVLAKKAAELGAQYVATGHYARKGYDAATGRYFLMEGLDLSKDQSYVLFGLTQEQLAMMLLPVGELEKTEVRRIAESLGLRVHDKPDSQEICFVKKDYASFVKGYTPERVPGPGRFVDQDGREVGQHEGSHLYTIGQRKRIKITHARPHFVTGINAEKNEVVVGFEEDLLCDRMTVRAMNWHKLPQNRIFDVKIRSRHGKAAARLEVLEDGRVSAHFLEPQKAVTPGQAAVFYDGSSVVGGGWIDSAPLMVPAERFQKAV